MGVKSLKHFLVVGLSLVFLATFLTSCGGGGGGSSTTSSTTTVNGQATLGPLSGASIILTDLNNKIIASTTAKSDNSSLSLAGSFSFSVKSSELPDVFLLKACGGRDIDPSDNNTTGNGVTNNGCIHAILTSDDLYGRKIEINPLAEMIYQDALNTYGANLSSVSESNLKTFLNQEAQLYLQNSGATYNNILEFNPIKDKSKSKISWDKVLSLLVFGIHKGEDFGTLSQRVMVLKSYLKKNGVYVNSDNESIEQIKDDSKNERFITSITKSNDNSSIGTFHQVFITNSGEIIDIYVSKINDTESYLSALIKKQGHALSIEGKTTLLQGLSFNKNTIANFIEPLIQITSDNSSSMQIKIDKRLVEKISNHEVVLKIDGMKPSSEELQIDKDDPELKWEIEKTNEKSTHVLFGSVGLDNGKNINVDIMKDGSIVLEMPIYVYDTEILKQDLQYYGEGIINGCLNLIVDGASLALEGLCSSTGAGAIVCAPAAVISAYSLSSDVNYLIHIGSNFYKSHTISSAFGILEYDNKNKLEPGKPYTPIFFIRHDSDYGEDIDIHMNGYYTNGNSYGVPESLNLDYGKYYFKPHTGYIIVPSRKFYIFDSLESTNSNLFKLNNTNLSSFTPYTPFVTIGVEGDGIKFASYTSFKIDLNNQKIYTNFTYSVKNNQLYLDASSSVAPDGSIESYVWKNLAGETIATGKIASVSFSDLVVKDGLTSITLETRSENYTGERTKVISLCGQNEVYENGACVLNVPGSTNESDTTPPSTPTGLTVKAVSPTQINLSWNASTDNLGVVGYKIYRNSNFDKTSSTTSASDTGLSPSTKYCYTITAYDAAGNESAKSNQVCVDTLSQTAYTYNVGGNVIGLNGTLVLQNNNTDTLTITSDGPFSFTGITGGSPYNITVKTQPTGQICIVTNGTGIVSEMDITNIEVSCTGSASGKLGNFDPSFGNNGVVTYDSISSKGGFITIDSQGKILVMGGTSNVWNGDNIIWRYNSDGKLDTSFGNNGIITHGIDDTNAYTSITVNSDGKILVTGYDSNGVTVRRYNIDGELDSSFGYKGVSDYGGDGENEGLSIITDLQGRILVTGHDAPYMAIWRYTEDGKLDTSFGNGGVVKYGSGSYNSQGNYISIDSQGRILVTGYYKDIYMAIWRYTEDGKLDTSFGNGGVVKYDNGSNCHGNFITTDSQGRILVAGRCSSNSEGSTMYIWRYNSDGKLDTSFGNNGIITNSNGNSITLDSHGRILVAGKIGNDMAIWRYTEDGKLDTSFGNGGVVKYGGDNIYGYQGNFITTDSEERILVTGYSYNSNNKSYSMNIWRYISH